MQNSLFKLAVFGAALVAGQFSLQSATTYTFQQGVNGYTGTVDTQLRGATPDQDDSTLAEVGVDADDGGSQNHVLLRFEKLSGTGAGQIPAGSAVVAASLTIYLTDNGDIPALHRVLKAWSPTNTWNTFDDVSFDGVTADDVEAAVDPDATFTATGSPVFKTIDLPVKTIQDWLDGKKPNYGWALIPSGGDGVDLASAEDITVANRPKLTIIAGAAGEPVISSVNPANGATAVPVDSNIEFIIKETTLKVSQSSVQLLLNGQSVKPTITQDAATGELKITYDPPANLTPEAKTTVKLTFSDTAATPHITTQDVSFTTRPNTVTLFAIDDKQVWRYNRTGTDLGKAWKEKNFNDTTWEQGKALIADESTAVEPVRTPISRNSDAGDYLATIYFRTHFTFSGDPKTAQLQLRHVIDDGAIFYLNGVEVHRFGYGFTADPAFDDTAATGHENAYSGPYDVANSSLAAGDNVFAVEVHQSGAGSSDIVFGAELLQLLSVGPAPITAVAIDATQKWRYINTGEDLGSAWKEKSFNDSAWPQGSPLLAFETGATAEPIRTELSRQGPDGSNITTDYFRTHFTFTGDPKAVILRLRHVVDDALALYLNGVELYRFYLPATGPIAYDTLATPSDHENRYEGPFELAATALVAGDNVLAAEVHQNSASSSDMVFGLVMQIIAAPTAPPAPTGLSTNTLVAIDDKQKWRYENTGKDLGTAWKDKSFNDASWPDGMALFAFETGATAEPIRTTLSRTAAGQNIITDYFRSHFTFTGDPATTKLQLRHVVDDAVAIYLNGTEVYRFYLPATGAITASTLATPSDHENKYEGPFDIPASALVAGDNVIAAEVHQNSATSSDMVFGLELKAIVSGTAPTGDVKITKFAKNADGSITIEWTGGGTLQAGAAVTGPWQDVAGAASPYTLKPTAATLFGRIKK